MIDQALAPDYKSVMYSIITLLFTTIIPKVPTAFAWIAGWFKSGQTELIEYLKKDNAELKAKVAVQDATISGLQNQINLLTHQISELQIAVGNNKQGVDELKQDNKIIATTAKVITSIVEPTL